MKAESGSIPEDMKNGAISKMKDMTDRKDREVCKRLGYD